MSQIDCVSVCDWRHIDIVDLPFVHWHRYWTDAIFHFENSIWRKEFNLHVHRKKHDQSKTCSFLWLLLSYVASQHACIPNTQTSDVICYSALVHTVLWYAIANGYPCYIDEQWTCAKCRWHLFVGDWNDANTKALELELNRLSWPSMHKIETRY